MTQLRNISAIIVLLLFCIPPLFGGDPKWKELIEFEQDTAFYNEREALLKRNAADPYWGKDHLFADTLIKLMQADPDMLKNFDELADLDVSIVTSPDRKMRIVSWCKKSDHYTSCRKQHLVQYSTGKGKTRYLYTGQQLESSRLISCHLLDYIRSSSNIKHIHSLREGLYLIEAEGFRRHELLAFDISRGILKDAYLFMNEKGEPANMLTTPTGEQYPSKDNAFLLDMDIEKLKIPRFDSLTQLPVSYDSYYFNGSLFEDSLSYQDRLHYLIRSECRIARAYYKNSNHRKCIKAITAKSGFTLLVEVVHDKDLFVDYPPFTTTYNDLKDHMGQPFSTTIFMKADNPFIGIENLRYDNIKPHIDPDTAKLNKVTYVAGREEAYPDELLTYTAVSFNRQIRQDELKRVHWMVRINDGELHFLDHNQYWGTQIDLRMKDEWVEKPIEVIAYIDGEEIDRNVSARTEVVKYEYREKRNNEN